MDTVSSLGLSQVTREAKAEALRLNILESPQPTTGLYSLDQALKSVPLDADVRIGVLGYCGSGKSRFAEHIFNSWKDQYSCLLKDRDLPGGKKSSLDRVVFDANHQVKIETLTTMREDKEDFDPSFMSMYGNLQLRQMDLAFGVSISHENKMLILKVTNIKHRWGRKIQPFFCEMKWSASKNEPHLICNFEEL